MEWQSQTLKSSVPTELRWCAMDRCRHNDDGDCVRKVVSIDEDGGCDNLELSEDA
jgi:hypothetical protein